MRALVALGMVAGALFMATPAQAGLGRVVALGDSSSTGTGLGTLLPGSPPSCERTDGGFPELAMNEASHGEFINRTCNGASTQALFYGYASIPEQTSVLDGSERVVILAIGDNNAQFGAVTNNCLAHTSNITGDVCTSTYGSGASNQLPVIATAGITTTQGFAPSVGSTLDQIHAKSPLAKIFLVGYLRVAPPDGVTCDTPFDSTWPRSYLNLTPTDAPVFAAWEDTVNASLESEAAGRSFVRFVNMQPESIAHNACNPAAERWVNPFPQITPDTVDGLSIHPSSAGAAAVKSALLSAFTGEGLNLGPDIAISSPTDGSYTAAPTATLNYSTTSSLGTPDCTPASGSSLSLEPGPNTFAVSCSDSAGNLSSAQTTINRGSPPVVAITAPSIETTHTTANSVNVAYTVDGSSSIPPGTTCTVSGLGSTDTQVNAVSLTVGTNTITVSCTNAFGAESASFSIERGSVPSLAIVQPSSETWTASELINLSFTVDGNSEIPPGTTCTVNAVATSSATVNAVVLLDGPNTIELSCSNAFGINSTSRTITRGDGPVVEITDPQNGSTTTATSTIVAFTINGSAAIPPGTTCSVGPFSTTSTSANLVNLGLGANTITVSCTNEVGSDQQSIVVTRASIAEPTSTPSLPLLAAQLTVSISSVSPSHFSPLKKGKPFLRTSRKGGARIRVTLSAATSIRVRVEQLGGRKVRTRWTKFALPAGVSTLRLSGRAAKRALKPGRYRIRLSVSGTNQSRISRPFRIDR